MKGNLYDSWINSFTAYFKLGAHMTKDQILKLVKCRRRNVAVSLSLHFYLGFIMPSSMQLCLPSKTPARFDVPVVPTFSISKPKCRTIYQNIYETHGSILY